MGNVESKKKCTQDQTKHDYKTEGISTDQAAKTQSNWASPLPWVFHPCLIEEAMPRG